MRSVWRLGLGLGEEFADRAIVDTAELRRLGGGLLVMIVTRLVALPRGSAMALVRRTAMAVVVAVIESLDATMAARMAEARQQVKTLTSDYDGPEQDHQCPTHLSP